MQQMNFKASKEHVEKLLKECGDDVSFVFESGCLYLKSHSFIGGRYSVGMIGVENSATQTDLKKCWDIKIRDYKNSDRMGE